MQQQLPMEEDGYFDSEDAYSDVEALPAGTRLLGGQYTIERYLSSGGFGITYMARDSLDRQVVIKECYPEALCARRNKTVKARSSGQTGEFQSLVSMFVREARSIAKLKHPNIVGVHQIFEDNQTAYMALDLIEGQDLLCMIESNSDRLTPDKVVVMLRTLLDAIVTVHDEDMLHRDISPDNILVNPWGNPVLIDFGAAREQASKKSRAISALLVVKDGYSPQEFYISGGKQAPSSDLYSLAATFYHVITGEAPPNSQNRLAAMAANRPDPYEPLAGRLSVYSAPFLEAIDLAMNVFPQDRLQSAREWIAMIDGHSRDSVRQPKALKEKVDLEKIVSDLVTEADRVAAEAPEDIDTEPKEAVAEMVPERKLEYLPPEEDDDVAPAPLSDGKTAYKNEVVKQFWERNNQMDIARRAYRAKRQRARQRKIGVLVIVFGIAFNIYESPSHNVATMAGVELENLLELGRDLSIRTNQFIAASL